MKSILFYGIFLHHSSQMRLLIYCGYAIVALLQYLGVSQSVQIVVPISGIRELSIGSGYKVISTNMLQVTKILHKVRIGGDVNIVNATS